MERQPSRAVACVERGSDAPFHEEEEAEPDWSEFAHVFPKQRFGGVTPVSVDGDGGVEWSGGDS